MRGAPAACYPAALATQNRRAQRSLRSPDFCMLGGCKARGQQRPALREVVEGEPESLQPRQVDVLGRQGTLQLVTSQIQDIQVPQTRPGCWQCACEEQNHAT